MVETTRARQAKVSLVEIEELDGKWLNGALAACDRYEIVFVARGEGSAQIGARLRDFAPGVLVVCPPRMQRAWRLAPGSESFAGTVLRFQARALPEGLLALPEAASLRELVGRARRGLIGRVADRQRLVNRLRSVQRTTGVLQLARLYVALDLVASLDLKEVIDEEKLAGARLTRETARLEAAKRYIEERFAGPLSRAEVAAQTGMDESAFSRFFRRATGSGFSDYLASLRARRAAALLGARRDLSLAEVARRSGFRGLSAFHAQFKKRLGTTPQAYRAAANAEAQEP